MSDDDKPSVHMTPGEKLIYSAAFGVAWATLGTDENITTLACHCAAAGAGAVAVFRLAVAELPQSDPARPFLDGMRKP